MTNTGNRRRRERATRERADAIADRLEGLGYGLEHRLADADLGGAYERLRELLSADSGEVEAFRGLLRQHAAPDAATVSALLDAARAPADGRGLTIRYAPGADPVRRPLAAHPDPEVERWLTSPAGQQLVERIADTWGWSPEEARDTLRSVARPSPRPAATVHPEPSTPPPRSPHP